ncbi:LAMI_0H04808g1_1 [Lachancea mirantina]|uniref:LAMI_0H04808g1_1 n=1 Tax=Lachancea mirantina TaxID=1230905 RepID=A0A1G4KEP3_9SACH|nr:LAMI_0H04808g1_1 [Lachancea mirantina]
MSATLESALTGALASCLANTIVYPLDLIKAIIQTQQKDDQNEDQDETSAEKNETKYRNLMTVLLDIIKEKGLTGIYRGLPESIAAGFVQNFSYFFWYSNARNWYYRLKMARHKSKSFSTTEELILGIVAASISQVFTNPIGVLATCKQTSADTSRSNILEIARDVYRQNGKITDFWRGFKVSLVLTINPSITYTSYERLKTIFLKLNQFTDSGIADTSAQLTPGQNFLLGVISKIISTLVTQPLIVSKACLQKAGSKFTTFQEVLVYLYKKGGILNLWRGLVPQILKGVLVQGFLFMFKGELSKLLRVLSLYLKVAVTRRYKIT